MAADDAGIMVVDEYPEHRATYAAWLRDIDRVQVVEAGAAAEALQLAQDRAFALFVLELGLPDMHGFELAARLRESPRAGATPIVFVNSSARPPRPEDSGYRIGEADFLLAAPVDGEALVRAARAFVGLFRQQEEIRRTLRQVQLENRKLHNRLRDFLREKEHWRLGATQDTLTGLPNRLILHDRLTAAIARANREGRRLALAHVSVDGVQDLHQRHGRTAARQLMVTLAARLSEVLRATDTVARIGTDEFGVILERIETPEVAEATLRKMHAALSAPTAIELPMTRERLQVTPAATIGAVIYPDDAPDVESLMVLAEITLNAIADSGNALALHTLVAKRPRAGSG